MTLADISNGPVWPVYIIAAALAALSLLLLSGRGSWLLAGYNTAPKAKKEQYDEKKLCRIMGAGLGVITLIILGMAVFEDVLPASAAYVTFGGVILVAVVMVVLANTTCKKK